MQDGLRLEGLTLTVESVAKSVEFYGPTLGLEVACHSEPAFAMNNVGGELGETIGLISIEEARKEGAEEMTPTQ
jgi:catechol-2,3-dioxygenase